MKKVVMYFKEIDNTSEKPSSGVISAANVDIQKMNEQIDALKKSKAVKEGDALDEFQTALKSVKSLSDAVIMAVWSD